MKSKLIVDDSQGWNREVVLEIDSPPSPMDINLVMFYGPQETGRISFPREQFAQVVALLQVHLAAQK